MARIRDLWHKARPGDDEPECDEHRAKSRRMVATGRHGTGKRWLLVYRDPANAERSEAFTKLPEAERRKVEVEADVQRGDYIDPKRGEVTFAAIADEWLTHHTVGPTTRARYAAAVDHLNRQFGDYPIDLLARRPSLIKSWQDGRRTKKGKRVAAKTLNQERWVLGAIFESAADDEIIRRSPMSKVKAPVRRKRGKLQVWPADVVEAIITNHAECYRMVPTLGAEAGLRQGEAFGLALEDVDFLRRTVTVNRQVLRADDKLALGPPKHGSYGTIPVSEELIERLAEHVRKFPPVEVTLPWVAVDAEPDETRTVRLLSPAPRSRSALRYNTYNVGPWHKALRSVGIDPAGKETGFHMLRHWYASHLLAEGVPITDVAERMRHNLSETYSTYGHFLPSSGSGGRRSVPSLFRRSASVPPDKASSVD